MQILEQLSLHRQIVQAGWLVVITMEKIIVLWEIAQHISEPKPFVEPSQQQYQVVLHKNVGKLLILMVYHQLA